MFLLVSWSFAFHTSQRSFDVLISREGKKEQRRSEPWRDWGELAARFASSLFPRFARR